MNNQISEEELKEIISNAKSDLEKDAERWRFIRKFLAVEDIDGSLDGKAVHVLCIKESAFESSMIGFPRDVSIEVAIDAAIAKATGESE